MASAITEENVQKTVYEALPQFGVDEDAITRDATFEDLDVDSLDLRRALPDHRGRVRRWRSRATTSARSRRSATRSTW